MNVNALGREKSRTLGPRQGAVGSRSSSGASVKWEVTGGVGHHPACNLRTMVGYKKDLEKAEFRTWDYIEEVPTVVWVRDSGGLNLGW